METYRGWKRRIAIIFYIITFMTFVSLRYRTHENSILIMLVHNIQLVSVERLVFDVFGQMWGTMLLNGLSTISLLAGLLAVCAAEKLAIALVCVQRIISRKIFINCMKEAPGSTASGWVFISRLSQECFIFPLAVKFCLFDM